MTGRDAVREQLAAVMPAHQSWCHAEAHAECCGAGDCDCGVADSLERLLPVVDLIATDRAAAELRAAAEDENRWHSQPAAGRLLDRADALLAATEGAGL